ncbi:MAG: zinc ribbon domain-containing protein [Armatimonadia bacterium]
MATSDVQPGSPPAATAGTAPTTCYYCEAPLPAGAQVCSECGRKQYRVCFCGTTALAGLENCPSCGADWSERIKVRRRSRAVHIKPRKLLRSALIGALVTIVATAIFNLLVTALAERSIQAEALPAAFSAKLYYAWLTLSSATSVLFSRLLGGAGSFLLIALLGGTVGTLFYLIHIGYLRFSRQQEHGKHGTLRRRRRR